MTEQLDRRPMLCACSPEGMQEGQDLVHEVCALLGVGPERLLTAVVVSLNWDFDAMITGMPNDQWSAVDAEREDGDYKVRVECDLLEHGVAGVWKAFHERFPDAFEPRTSTPF